MAKNNLIKVQNVQVKISSQKGEDFICITDIAKAKTDANRAADVIKNWIRNRTTLEFLVLGKTFTTPILKWSNSTTLKVKRA